jgi:uncharacterized protein YndB with AHSA1/START domain
MQSLELTTPTPTSACIVRTFDAPVELAWRTHTEPELVKQWMTGPPDHSLPVCEIDLRVGGKARDAAMQPGFQEGYAASYETLDALMKELQLDS